MRTGSETRRLSLIFAFAHEAKLTLITDYSKGRVVWGGMPAGILRTPWGMAATVLTETPAWQLLV
jgi:hypothetical protein